MLPADTVTDTTETAEGESHLDAARAFLADDTQAPTKPAPEATKPEPTKPEPTKPAPEKFNPLADVVKLPGAKDAAKPDAAPAADQTPEDIAKGLAEPRADSKSHAGWQELKKRANEERVARLAVEKERDALKAQVSTQPKAAVEATNARIQELETQVKTYSERLKVIDLKSHPEFEDKYVKPQQAAKANLANIAKGDEVEVNLDEMLSLKGKAFNQRVSETLDSLTPYARVKFQAALDSYLTATLGAEEALTKADEFLKTAKQNGGARTRAAFDGVAANYQGVFAPAQADEKAAPEAQQEVATYNEALAGIKSKAEAYAFGQLDEAGVADIAHKAALYDFTLAHGLPLIGKKFETHMAKREAYIAELEGQVKSLRAAGPTVNSGSGAPAPVSSGEPESHLEAARKFLANQNSG
jgi:hypothetical protein